MSLMDSRPYAQTTIGDFDNLTASQKFTSCHEFEFHITDEELIEYCNEVEVMMKEVNNNIDAPGGTRGLFQNASPERNSERSPLFILREKPKRNYSREFREKAKSNLEEKFKAAIDDNHDNSISEREASDRGYIEKEDTYNVNETLVPSNQCKTGISFQTANGKKISISEESKISIQNILREFQDDLQETDYETELKDIKARISNKSMESKFRTTATRKRLMALNDESSQTGHSTLNVPKFRKKHLLSLNPKFNFK
ncbi:hypothetical protein GQX74_009133 [Glossina fuscipes]|nr:hypothetical protein GQX74_009133 [Glossina fuscipes]